METTLVVGAGVVGLAIARKLAIEGHDVTVLEAESVMGLHTSGRNSYILHAGIYYPAGSLKGRLCVKGRNMLYDYCATHNVAHKRVGKLLVATTDDQVQKLKDYLQKGRTNEVMDLRWLSAEEACKLEPELHCLAAIHSPSTGIVDGKGLMQALRADTEAHGGKLVFNSRVLGADVTGPSKVVQVENTRSGETCLLQAEHIVNAAGLWAQHVAERFVGLQRNLVPPLHLARGCYFTLKGKAPFSHLIYPMPEEAGLGTHLTLDIDGNAKFGPDAEYIAWDPDEGPDYRVDPCRVDKFYTAIRHYWPGLQDGQLQADFAGVRPKVAGPGQPTADFVIQGPADHGITGLVNLFGIESPGLTSCLAIADVVAHELRNPKQFAKL